MDTNIISFKSPAAKIEEIPTTEVRFTAEQAMLAEAIVKLGNFLLENRDKIRYFVCCTELTSEEAPGVDNGEVHVMNSPIRPQEFAFALKVLDAKFYNRLHGVG